MCIVDNLMLKINAKLGGLNWKVVDFPDRVAGGPLMVVGADVTHPGPTGENRDFNKSVAAVIASMSRDLMHYVAVVRQQEPRKRGENTAREDIVDMEGIFRDLLNVSMLSQKVGGGMRR